MTREAIDETIEAHRRWDIRLRCAIETGRTIFTEENSAEKNCRFCPPLEDDSARTAAIRELHADLHREVSRILTLALEGRRREAKWELEVNPDYATLAAAFTGQLNSLAREIGRAQPVGEPEVA